VSPFLRAVEARTLLEREARLCFTPGRRLAGGHLDLAGQRPGGDRRSPKAIAEREERLAKRAEHVLALRGQGLMWTEIARRLAISARAARFAVTRLEHAD